MSICTTRGGTHVDHVAGGLSRDIIQDLVKKKVDGAAKMKPMNIKAAMFVFVRSTLVNPNFSSQIKSECTTKSSDFGSAFTWTPKFIKAILDTGIRDELMSVARFKEQKDLKKSDGCKKNNITGIPKLDDANWAGTPKSDNCTLIITEGDSAKALAISGLSVVGRDKWGVFPLRGKPRNVRDASVKQLTTNQEFSDLKKILGLQQDRYYKNLSELRYGKLMIMTDADLDGSHIKGLVLNMIHCFWPSLIGLGFVVSMVTPIIKVGKRSFFTNQTYEAWIRAQGGLPRGAKVKYYKGLGTSTSAEAKEYFKEIDQLTVGFKDSPDATKSVVMAFDKSRADARKQWLQEFIASPRDEVRYGEIQSLTVSDFINHDMVNFSIADVKRSIPHVCDGLKPSQRKVMYGCMKRNLTSSEIKVAQLCGYISEVSAYHHGETSLQGAIVGMAHNYVGSNNINLLEPCGQFGTRLMGGKDAASARYIFTKLSKDATNIFNPLDNSTLKFLDDDGKSIEPEYYMPILPMVLVNGAEGIGTGYSTQVPCYNPDDIKKNLLRCMRGETPVHMTPWYKGFRGAIYKKDERTWTLLGVHSTSQSGVITVTELPPGRWTQDYKEHLDSLCEKDKIRSYDNHSTEEHPHFIIRGYDGIDPVKDLALSRTIHNSNMWLMTPGGIKKYASAEEIVVDFFEHRLSHYKKRKANMLKEYKYQAEIASNKARFVRKVVDDEIKIFKRKKVDVERDLQTMEFKQVQETWEYLLNIKTVQYTEEAIARLRDEEALKNSQYKELKETKILDMWENDLKF